MDSRCETICRRPIPSPAEARAKEAENAFFRSAVSALASGTRPVSTSGDAAASAAVGCDSCSEWMIFRRAREPTVPHRCSEVTVAAGILRAMCSCEPWGVTCPVGGGVADRNPPGVLLGVAEEQPPRDLAVADVDLLQPSLTWPMG